MPAVGLAVLFLGYSVTYYGITQIRGQNFGLLDLVLPGRWSVVRMAPPPNDAKEGDTGTIPFSSSTSTTSTTAPGGLANPEGATSVPGIPSTATLPNPVSEGPNPSPGLPMD